MTLLMSLQPGTEFMDTKTFSENAFNRIISYFNQHEILPRFSLWLSVVIILCLISADVLSASSLWFSAPSSLCKQESRASAYHPWSNLALTSWEDNMQLQPAIISRQQVFHRRCVTTERKHAERPLLITCLDTRSRDEQLRSLANLTLVVYSYNWRVCVRCSDLEASRRPQRALGGFRQTPETSLKPPTQKVHK